jgi:fatty acid-binding protein DegV
MESILSDLFKEIKILADALGRVAVRDTGYSDVGAEIQYKRYERMIERGRKLTDEQAAKMERLRQQFTRTGEFAPDTTKLEKKIAALPVPISWEKTLQDQLDEADRLAAQIASTPTVARPGK